MGLSLPGLFPGRSMREKPLLLLQGLRLPWQMRLVWPLLPLQNSQATGAHLRVLCTAAVGRRAFILPSSKSSWAEEHHAVDIADCWDRECCWEEAPAGDLSHALSGCWVYGTLAMMRELVADLHIIRPTRRTATQQIDSQGLHLFQPVGAWQLRGLLCRATGQRATALPWQPGGLCTGADSSGPSVHLLPPRRLHVPAVGLRVLCVAAFIGGCYSAVIFQPCHSRASCSWRVCVLCPSPHHELVPIAGLWWCWGQLIVLIVASTSRGI